MIDLSNRRIYNTFMGKNVIGVCVTRVQGEMCRTFLGSLFQNAREAGFRVCVFQSVYDFDEMDETGAGYVFKTIPYDSLCALVVLHDTIYDEDLKNEIIDKAVENGIPVIMARDSHPKCFSLISRYEEAYYKLICEVVKKNDIKDVFYIGGRKHSGKDSRVRVEVFKRAMKDMNIPFDDSMIGYGEYYEDPTYRIVDSLLDKGARPPRAIFCANDIMALAVIERLGLYGYKVPDDCIVVGFDGLESAQFAKPRLTTCYESMDNLTCLTVETVRKAINGEIEIGEYEYTYEPVFAESAGYESPEIDNEETALEIFRRFRLAESQEESCNAWIDQMLHQQDIEGYKLRLPSLMDSEMDVMVRTEGYWKFHDSEDENRLPDHIMAISRDREGVIVKRETGLNKMLRKIVEETPVDRLTYISAISMHNMVFGLAADRCADPYNDSGRMNRFAVTLNRGFSLAINGEKQLYLADQINKSRYIDPLTKMLNIDGACRWYKNYMADDASDSSYMLLGVYSLVSYQDILNTYGVDFLETCLQFIASTLAEVNPENIMIARIAADSFAVVYIFPEEHNSSNEIEVTINTFFTAIEARRKESEKWNMLDVGCGYVSDELGDNDSFEGYINAAVARLYRNRAAQHKKAPEDPRYSEGQEMLDFRHKLISLIQNDRFIYHFQPIVDTHNGEIIAYEALMRTDAEIGLNPLEVLDAAEVFDKFADLERTTFAHIFARVRSQADEFDGKRIFINTIPGHFLTKVEVRNFRKEYGDLLKKVTIEITEAQTISPDEIDRISHLAGEDSTNDIAVDDYGMGHSNIVNLLEYKPQIVKIDRYLVSNIQNDHNKQLFVRNLIEFASENGIKVLAEGVETSEELKCVIGFGVDYAQGFYLARPSFEIIQKIPNLIREEILACNGYSAKRYGR